MASFNWQFDKELNLYRAGCGCRMIIELDEKGSLMKRFVKVCKRHQEAK